MRLWKISTEVTWVGDEEGMLLFAKGFVTKLADLLKKALGKVTWATPGSFGCREKGCSAKILWVTTIRGGAKASWRNTNTLGPGKVPGRGNDCYLVVRDAAEMSIGRVVLIGEIRFAHWTEASKSRCL